MPSVAQLRYSWPDCWTAWLRPPPSGGQIGQATTVALRDGVGADAQGAVPLIDELAEQRLIGQDFLGAGGLARIGIAAQAAQGVGRNTEFDCEIARHHHILL